MYHIISFYLTLPETFFIIILVLLLDYGISDIVVQYQNGYDDDWGKHIYKENM